ncbi:DNA-binding protein [Massilia sp. G4R7]|uniref:DNA-binding protein n=1 Tax=Massilia phyllostachyos TaxID=2898585 RepID=A0ABS8PZS0_9BURK|nr:DNA-binding protein [Massilia phyllostachyos]MCD2514839.1 DNA-binding protein [Massilia phyllostachyos]
MTLQNLLAIQSLIEFNAQREDIQRLLAAAERNLQDASVTAISDENRFDAAYKCIMQCAMVALWANGYRPSTSKPGHHQTAIQSLALTIALDSRTVILLDKLRRQRNLNDYDGDPIAPSVVEESQRQAQALLRRVKEWLSQSRPDLC